MMSSRLHRRPAPIAAVPILAVLIAAVPIVLAAVSGAARAESDRSLCIEGSDVKLASEACDRVIAANPKDADAYAARASQRFYKRDYDGAVSDYTEVIRLEPGRAQAYNNRGLMWRFKQDYERAIADFDEAIRLDPAYAKAWYNRAVANERADRLEPALADYRRFIELAPADASAAGALRRVAAEIDRRRGATAQAPPAATPAVAATLPVQPSPPPAAAPAPAPTPAVAPRERRVALVIGNARYQNVATLPNAANDSRLLAATLRDVGFQAVLVRTDLTREQTLQALREFAREADTADWATVYYAGHGIEFGGVNYLIPIEARLEVDRDIELEAVDVGKVLAAIDGARRLRLVILDACRNNPFASQMRRTIASRSVGAGLARIEPEAGTLIVYAAKHGEVALDGDSANSPFAEALAKRIQQRPPAELRRLFDLVRDDVMIATRKRQQPFSYGSLSGSEDFYFAR